MSTELMNDDHALTSAVSLGMTLGAVKAINGIPAIVLPAGATVQTFPEVADRETPAVKKGSAATFDAASFCAYFNDYKGPDSRIFANPQLDRLEFVGIFDHHGKTMDSKATYGRYRVTFKMQTSAEWKAWHSANKKAMNQGDFAQFMEDNAGDVIDPSAATMLEVATSLQAVSSVSFKQSTRLQNGQTQISYNENIDGRVGAAGTLEVPQSFKINIPIFFGDARFELVARLRYRINNGSLQLWYDLHRPEYVINEAFESALESIEKQTETRVILGTHNY